MPAIDMQALFEDPRSFGWLPAAAPQNASNSELLALCPDHVLKVRIHRYGRLNQVVLKLA